VGIFTLLFTQISLRDLFLFLKKMDPLWAISGLGVYLLSLFFQSLRYRWLLRTKALPLAKLFSISVLYNLSLMVLPSKLGELAYPYLLNKISETTITEGLASLIALRGYDLLIILISFIFSTLWIQVFFEFSPLLTLLLAVLLITLILLIFFYMTTLLIGCSKVVGNISNWLAEYHRNPFRWLQRKLHEIAEDFYAIRARRTYLPVTLTSLLAWLSVFWMFYALIRGFGIEIYFLEVVFGSTVALLISILPISAFGKWGILEAGWTIGFLMVGLPKEKAIVTGFWVHAMVFMICAVLGSFFLITLKLSPLSLKKKTDGKNK
ncbi:MAG: lysylphosphatidylglycerol synthase transmembrane domain-containing protein, partial [Thermodesulfobacteriota bacterium]